METNNKKQTLLENTITKINKICADFARWEADYLPVNLETVYNSNPSIQPALLEAVTHTLTLATQERDRIIDKEIENLYDGWRQMDEEAANEIPD